MVGAAVAASGDVANSAHPEQNPGVHQQKIVIRNNHGEKLVGLLHEAGSTEIVILGHGFQSTKIHFLDLISYLGSWFVQVYNFNFLYSEDVMDAQQFLSVLFFRLKYSTTFFTAVSNFPHNRNDQAATCFHRLYQWSLPIKRAQDMTVMALWTKATDNEAVQMSIGKTWKEFLDYNDVIGFKFHEDAKKLDRGAKTKYST